MTVPYFFFERQHLQSDIIFTCIQQFDACDIDDALREHTGVVVTIEIDDGKNCHTHGLKIKNLDVILKYKHISYVKIMLFDKNYPRLRFTHPEIKKLDIIFERWCETKNVNAAIEDIINAGLERML